MDDQKHSLIEAEIYKVQTLADGGFRVTLDLQNYNKNLAHFLMDKAVDNEILSFVIVNDAESQ